MPLVRQLRGEVTGEPDLTAETVGIGGNISGVLVPRWDADDRIKFAANGGSGIGRYITDLSSLGGQDAVYDPSSACEPFRSRAHISATSAPGPASSPRL
jgi:hypothetical protein